MPRHLSALAVGSLLGLTSAIAATPIASVPTAEPVVALTFDDGPHPEHTQQMLDLFAREGVRVTFFEIANNVLNHPELARAIIAGGHEIGNHTVTHANLAKLADPAVIHAEIVDAQRIIQDTTGIVPVVFRAPFLNHSPEVWSVLAELGLPAISANVSSFDWEPDTTATDVLTNSVQAGPGAIVLLHTWPEKTLQSLPEIIAQLRAKGLSFVTVSELLALRAEAAPSPAAP